MKKSLSERDICTKYITPALQQAGWDSLRQIREEVTFTAGRVIVRGKLHTRGQKKRADYILFHKPNIPIALIEAKDNTHPVGAGMQQALAYAETLDILFIYSSNGDAFMEQDRTAPGGVREQELPLDGFPSPGSLWQRYCKWKGITSEQEPVITQDYYVEPGWKIPRYYQLNAVNKTIEAIASGQNRILLVMATGTGKTYTAFQIIWRLWKSRLKKRILYLADRNILIDQTMTNDFKPFGSVMTKIRHRKVDKSFEIYLALYQGISGTEEFQNIYREFSPDFFDLIVIDECHRGVIPYDIVESFLRSVEAALLREESMSLVSYPQNSISPWNAHQLDAANQKILDAISGTANVYAIFTAPNNASSFSLRYIGKTTRKLARQRVRNHLIKKHEKTGAKFQNVKTHVLSGGQVKISWLEIEPESLRNYLEEELINKHKEADWSRENA